METVFLHNLYERYPSSVKRSLCSTLQLGGGRGGSGSDFPTLVHEFKNPIFQFCWGGGRVVFQQYFPDMGRGWGEWLYFSVRYLVYV